MDTHRVRGPFAVISTSCAVVLAAWIVILTHALPSHQTTHAWRTAWVGFDVAELVAFAVTAWSARHGRQITAAASLVAATLLLCDAWFDVALSWGTSEQWASLASAVLVELPLAGLLWSVAYRVARRTLVVAHSRVGQTPPSERIRDIELFSLTAGGQARGGQGRNEPASRHAS